MIKVRCEVVAVEKNGCEIWGEDPPVIVVENHGSGGEYILLTVGGTQYTVPAADMLAAIENAKRTAK